MWNTENTAQTVLNHVLAPSDDSEQCGGCEAAYSWDNARSVCPYHQGMMAGYDKALGDIAETAIAFQRDSDLVGMVVDRAQQLRIHDWQLMQRAENHPEPEGLSEHEKQVLNTDVPADPRWAPAQQHVPHLLDDLMHMGTVRYSGREIEQYKHCDTRRYLNLDETGQAWEVAVDGETGAVGARRIDGDAALAHAEGHLG